MGTMTGSEAKQIYQDLLDRVTGSYLSRDFDAFASVVHLPHHISTPFETITIREPHHLKAVFDAVCTLTHSGEPTLTAVCHDAKPKGRDRIDGSYSNLAPDHAVLPAEIKCQTVLMWIGNEWKACMSRYEFAKDDVVAVALRAAVST